VFGVKLSANSDIEGIYSSEYEVYWLLKGAEAEQKEYFAFKI